VLADPARRAEYDVSLADAPLPVAVLETASDPKAREQLAAHSYKRAKQLIAEKDYHPAVEMLREAIRFVPDNAEYRFALAQVELKNAKWTDKALANLKEAARLAPRNREYIRVAARTLYQHGQAEDAETFARRLLSLEPTPESQELLDSITAKHPDLPPTEELTLEPLPVPLPATADEVDIGSPTPPEEGRRPSLFSRLFRHRT
jgi:predicted Zn-dependent protease